MESSFFSLIRCSFGVSQSILKCITNIRFDFFADVRDHCYSIFQYFGRYFTVVFRSDSQFFLSIFDFSFEFVWSFTPFVMYFDFFTDIIMYFWCNFRFFGGYYIVILNVKKSKLQYKIGKKLTITGKYNINSTKRVEFTSKMPHTIKSWNLPKNIL